MAGKRKPNTMTGTSCQCMTGTRKGGQERIREYQKQYMENNKERIKEKIMEYRKTNKEKLIKKYRKRWQEKKSSAESKNQLSFTIPASATEQEKESMFNSIEKLIKAASELINLEVTVRTKIPKK